MNLPVPGTISPLSLCYRTFELILVAVNDQDKSILRCFNKFLQRNAHSHYHYVLI